MPWLILHRCNVSQSEPSEYSVIKVRRDNEVLTQVVCPNPDCREEFFVKGHEMFSEAVSELNGQRSNLPPGFVIARTGRTT
jgi:hypothetical protein